MGDIHKISTGLTDKYGKEIFVGDIVRTYAGEIKLHHPLNEKVVCRDDIFYLENEDGISSLENNPQSLEVIGNIEENSELLKTGFRISFWNE